MKNYKIKINTNMIIALYVITIFLMHIASLK